MKFTIKKEFDYYLYWITERMNIFWRRYENNPLGIESSKDLFGASSKKIWSDDKIFQDYKFTNVYRSLDRVSQYLIKNVIYTEGNYSKEDIVWRILLFKHFNKIETWELLRDHFGDIRYNMNFLDISEYLDNLDSEILYGNAYMMASLTRSDPILKRFNIEKGCSKKNTYMKIWNGSLKKENEMTNILNSKCLEHLNENLSNIVGVGLFLAMQYAIDLNYSDVFNFDENEFIVPGPGSLRGMDRCFEGQKNQKDYVEILKWVQCNLENLLHEKGYDVKFLPNRKPTLIDIQNCFCETDKYLRGIGSVQEGVSGKRIKQKFKESSKKIEYFFPPKWNVSF